MFQALSRLVSRLCERLSDLFEEPPEPHPAALARACDQAIEDLWRDLPSRLYAG